MLEIEVQGARQVRPDAARGGAGLHRAAVAARRCARGSSAAAPTTRRRSPRGCAPREEELAAQDEFPHVVVNDRLEEAVEALAAIVASGMAASGGRVHSDA